MRFRPCRHEGVAADVEEDLADQPVGHRLEAGKRVALKTAENRLESDGMKGWEASPTFS